MLGSGDRMRQAGIQPHILVRFSGAGGRPPDTRHGKDWTAKHTVSLAPSPKLRVSGTGNKTQTPSGSFSRRPGAPLPTPSMHGTILKSHRCWSSGTAPRCMSCVSPGLEETGQRALPRCKTGPSRRQGDGRGEEPQRQSSWLARGVLERGAVISRHREGCRGGRGGGAPGAFLLHFVAVSYFINGITSVTESSQKPISMSCKAILFSGWTAMPCGHCRRPRLTSKVSLTPTLPRVIQGTLGRNVEK